MTYTWRYEGGPLDGQTFTGPANQPGYRDANGNKKSAQWGDARVGIPAGRTARTREGCYAVKQRPLRAKPEWADSFTDAKSRELLRNGQPGIYLWHQSQ